LLVQQLEAPDAPQLLQAESLQMNNLLGTAGDMSTENVIGLPAATDPMLPWTFDMLNGQFHRFVQSEYVPLPV